MHTIFIFKNTSWAYLIPDMLSIELDLKQQDQMSVLRFYSIDLVYDQDLIKDNSYDWKVYSEYLTK